VSNYEVLKAWRKLNKEKVAAQAQRYRKRRNDERRAQRWYEERGEMRAQLKSLQEELAQLRAKNVEERLKKEAMQAADRRAKDPEGQRRRNRAYSERQLAKREQVAGRPRPDLCELCNETSPLRIVFDHCHKTEAFRGWICDRCNKVLGLVYDSPDLLRKLAGYLEAHSGENHSRTA